MDLKRLIVSTALLTFSFSNSSYASNDIDEIKQVAEKFVKFVDNNEADKLSEILLPEMIQYAYLGGNLIPFKASDFVQMVRDKKLGGTPRKISIKQAEIVRGNTAFVIVSAVSNEYDFKYQLSVAKKDGKWVIVGILSDIVKVS